MTLTDDFLSHYGVKGMKWGVRKAQSSGKTRPKPKYTTRPDGSITIEAGYPMQRVFQKGRSADGSAGDNYFSFTKEDNKLYTAMMGAGAHSKFALIRKFASDSVSRSVAAEPLNAPSRAEGFRILKSALESVGPGDGVKRFKRDYDSWDGQLWYQDASAKLALSKGSPQKDAFYKALEDAGYNMLRDETDSDFLSESPVVILNGAKSLKNFQISEISKTELTEAKAFSDKYFTKKVEDM